MSQDSEMSIESQMSIDPTPNIIDFFLWISHGGNVSAENNLYKMKTKFLSIIMYSRPFDTITSDKLENIINNPCELILGSCPYVPIQKPDEKKNKKKNKNKNSYVYLPPILFTVNENEVYDNVRKYTGLYYMRITSTPQEIGTSPSSFAMNCKIVDGAPRIIYNYSDLINPFKYNQSNNKYTYSTIFRMVEDFCKVNRIDPSKALLGLFSCQSLIHKYGINYIQKIENLIPKHVDDHKESLETAPIIDNKTQLSKYNKGVSFSNTIICLDDIPNNWDALAGLKHQGCALNVLSFFRIITEEDAREKAVCLDLNGTSIFKIIDYLYTYIIDRDKSRLESIIGFLVRRLPFETAINEMITFIKETSIDNYCMIFKMYTMATFNGKDNHRGHTVAFYCKNEMGQKRITYVDPQLSGSFEFTLQINDPTAIGRIFRSISELINENYRNTFHFIDVIYTIQKGFGKSRLQYGVEYIFDDDYSIIKRTRDITHGGKKIQTHSKKIYLKKSSKLKKSDKKKKHLKKKLSKKKKHTHNKKTKKNRKYKKRYGGNKPPDDFPELMREIDAKNPDVETVLV